MKNIGTSRIYNTAFDVRDDVVLWDVQPIADLQIVKLKFLSTNSPNRQGLFLLTDKGIEVNGSTFPSIFLWEDTAPPEVEIKCLTENGWLSIYNVFHDGRKQYSQLHSSGMLVRENGSTVTYHCNDFGFETSFDKLVFSIEKI